MQKNYSELLKQLQLNAEEKKALEEFKKFSHHMLRIPQEYKALMKPAGKAHAKLAISACLEEAKMLADLDKQNSICIYLQNTWFSSFNLFNQNEEWKYSYEIDANLFIGIAKEPLLSAFNDFVTNLFGAPSTSEWRKLTIWNWSNIIINF